MEVRVHTDGGSRGNPGKAAWGFIAYGSGEDVLKEDAAFMGIATNNEAEYQAFLESVKWLKANEEELRSKGAALCVWKLDSKLVVEQLQKNWKIKEPRMASLAKQCWDVLDQLSVPYKITHIPRAENAAADALVNYALDRAE